MVESNNDEKYQEMIDAGQNPMKWNSFNLMGADFHDLLKKALTGGKEGDP
jgi:hypothetical protein